MDFEIKRQIVHALGVFSIILIHIFGKWYAALLMLLVSLTFLVMGEYRKNKKKYKLVKIRALDEFEDKIEDEFKTYERESELPFRGAIMFYMGCFLVTALFQTEIAIASIAVLSLSDALSTVVGTFFGKHKLPINKKKSWEGSTVFFAATLIILLFFVSPVEAIFIAAVVTIVEMLPRIDDNLSVPLITGILLWLI
ncbi:MAG: diacylglycerol/polyprenol kinase family protein [Candidatus Aenigmatarchaeota archaeon]